jgi:hypothetical protein
MDIRDLPPLTASSEMRWDPLLRTTPSSRLPGRTARTARPLQRIRSSRRGPGRPPRYPLPTTRSWPSRTGPRHSHARRQTLSLGCRFRGRAEVVCCSSDHDISFGERPLSRVRLMIDAWTDRTAELRHAARCGSHRRAADRLPERQLSRLCAVRGTPALRDPPRAAPARSGPSIAARNRARRTGWSCTAM